MTKLTMWTSTCLFLLVILSPHCLCQSIATISSTNNQNEINPQKLAEVRENEKRLYNNENEEIINEVDSLNNLNQLLQILPAPLPVKHLNKQFFIDQLDDYHDEHDYEMLPMAQALADPEPGIANILFNAFGDNQDKKDDKERLFGQDLKIGNNSKNFKQKL